MKTAAVKSLYRKQEVVELPPGPTSEVGVCVCLCVLELGVCVLMCVGGTS